MKKVLVVLAVVLSLALVTSVYAQKWDGPGYGQDQLAKGKSFKFAGEIVSIDPKAKTAMVKVGEKTALARFDYAKYEGAYKGVEDLKVGEKIAGTGIQLDGYNWITRVVDAATLPVKVKPGVKPN